ncbi:hypothetical protein B0H16DRAFT_1604638 [Mycena metata]|uniref:Uncharacterized protein n=1 Tax=Mycena metata TaxID=1033252 RepID=A0AAD7HI68_9AGAR|nr:hypothetical protein B0H16DRAFT_1604638 [Mycena metata]
MLKQPCFHVPLMHIHLLQVLKILLIFRVLFLWQSGYTSIWPHKTFDSRPKITCFNASRAKNRVQDHRSFFGAQLGVPPPFFESHSFF